MTDLGIQQAGRTAPPTPLPVSWLGKATSPFSRPDWAIISALTATQQKNLLAQIAYDFSEWDYTKIGTNNELGRYQFNVQTLESYGLLANGSCVNYGIDAVNYQHCWRQRVSTYFNHITGVENIDDFLNNRSAQESLAQQHLVNLYNGCLKIGTIRKNDTTDIVVGMLYVAWVLGVGTSPTISNTNGTGAYAWRYYNIGTGNFVYASGRYSAIVLSTSTANNSLLTTSDLQSINATVEPTGNTTVSANGVLPESTTTVPQVQQLQVNTGVIGSLSTVTQGITSSQQLRSSAFNLTNGIVSGAANGIIGGLAAGIGQNGGGVLNLAALAIQNPQSALATTTNMATTYAMQQAGNVVAATFGVQPIGGFVKELTQAETNSSNGGAAIMINDKIQQSILVNLATLIETTGNI